MGLWDVLSGKSRQWNGMKEEALQFVCLNLKKFIESNINADLNDITAFDNMRNALIAYYVGAVTVLTAELDGNLKTHKDRILNLSATSFLHIISNLHAHHILCMYNTEEGEDFFCFMVAAIRAMYKRSPRFIDDVQSFALNLREIDDSVMAARLRFWLHDQLVPILGLRQNDVMDAIFWADLELACVRVMRQLYDQPDWSDVVSRAFSRC